MPRTMSSPVLSSGTKAAVCVPKLRDVTLWGEVPSPRDNKPWSVPRCAQPRKHTLLAHGGPGSTWRVWAGVRSCVILCPGVCVHTCTSAHSCAGPGWQRVDVHVCLSEYMCTCMLVYVYAFMCACVCACVSLFVLVYVCVGMCV